MIKRMKDAGGRREIHADVFDHELGRRGHARLRSAGSVEPAFDACNSMPGSAAQRKRRMG
jgi:hypothetical protein